MQRYLLFFSYGEICKISMEQFFKQILNMFSEIS